MAFMIITSLFPRISSFGSRSLFRRPFAGFTQLIDDLPNHILFKWLKFTGPIDYPSPRSHNTSRRYVLVHLLELEPVNEVSQSHMLFSRPGSHLHLFLISVVYFSLQENRADGLMLNGNIDARSKGREGKR